jgi:hypothetical protein
MTKPQLLKVTLSTHLLNLFKLKFDILHVFIFAFVIPKTIFSIRTVHVTFDLLAATIILFDLENYDQKLNKICYYLLYPAFYVLFGFVSSNCTIVATLCLFVFTKHRHTKHL